MWWEVLVSVSLWIVLLVVLFSLFVSCMVCLMFVISVWR